MRNKGILSVFHKHLQREVFNTREFQQIVDAISHLGSMHVFKSLITPALSATYRSSRGAVKAGHTGVKIVDAIAEEAVSKTLKIAEKVAELPALIAEEVFHRTVLRAGRVFWEGTPYRRQVNIEQHIKPMKKMPRTQKEASEFVHSAVEVAKYDDLIEMYAPYTWQNIKAGYSAGELLGVGTVGFESRSSTATFDVSLYDEMNDRIIRKHNVWKLKQGKSEGPTVYKAEITDIL
ncbi:hypothetical protein NEMIN01_1107 [Nematocida minor]|uniref:uncharacterized protein n=1 Tax=Nematocida minor TaxID=1912983 RepID=UPI00221EA5BB|nr:uncharacterized protein NEMIN01_1107 [Nematocida minor]KAI5190569.1 hypothetical protein NEMIN01_1107 [Nematocida minor]